MGVLRHGAAHANNGATTTTTTRRVLMSYPKAAAGVFGVALLCLIAAVTLVELDPQANEPATSVGMSVLTSAGMGAVLRAKSLVDSREATYTRLEGLQHAAEVREDKDTAEKMKLSNQLDRLDEKIDHQTAEMAKAAARAEAESDTANEVILKAREHEHAAKADKRHAQTARRREVRETTSLTSIRHHTSVLEAKAKSELADAQRRSAKAAKLRQMARNYRNEASTLKENIRDVLRSSASSLSSSINTSQRAALHATEKAKSLAKQYARLQAKIGADDKSATLAQRHADQAALDAESEDKEAARLASRVAVELQQAQKNKRNLARLLSDAANPQGATTLRTALPKTLKSGDVPLGSQSIAHDIIAANNAANPSSSHKSRVSKEMQEAADKIRALERAKRAAIAREQAEKRAEMKLEKALKDKEGTKVDEYGPADKPASRKYESNFEAAMNYLNNRHMDGATGADDHGRDPVGRRTEGRRAFVGVFGRTPQLDAMATANLQQYQQDESELDRANYQGGEGQGERGANPF